ncbi:uncharacterized protein LOC142317967 [Lycorma delicatula]|uniref:uncharacterized protein LOC142317967 n=1 Tax=Lycorma delicatula TaxID=130591 RepID=UPI003F516FA6
MNKHVCKICSKKHHYLIHTEEINKSSFKPENNTYHALKLQTNKNVLLSTAVCNTVDKHGNYQTYRVLLDSGSQANFCTMEFARKLGLTLTKNNLPISGINNSLCQSNYSVTVKLYSRYENFTLDIVCAVLPNLTDNLPAESFCSSHLNLHENLFLADPNFNISSNIDVHVGAQYFLNLILPNKFVRNQHFPLIQETRLGCILAGNLPLNVTRNNSASSFFIRNDNKLLSKQIEKFWEVEEPILVKQTSHDNSICERNFIENTIRNKDGRFIVTLPRKSDNIKLGDSLNNAKNRFLSLERKLIQDPSFKKGYSNFINEYINLGHMSELNSKDLLIPDSEVFYLLHHAVFKETSLTTKLRVVFDGSAKSSNGLSVNDTLMIGPTVQQDLFSIILRFKVHNYVITSDITKMYRQILVTQKDSNLQRILWRKNPEQDLTHYALRTVTYDTTSASFLATRLVQIANDNNYQFPNACRAVLNDFYVDDLITGADSVHEIKQLKTDHKLTNDRKFDSLSSNELEFTLEFFIHQSQLAYFKSEINYLQNQRFILKQSKLSSLDPFLDYKGLLRVGGILEHPNLSFDKKHQLILHPHANITRLIIHSEHLCLLHAGLQLTHSSLRQRFWIVNAKIAIRSIVRKCLKCFRFNADNQSQQLGQLPSSRITPSRAFSSCAIDYGGPIMIRHGRQKSNILSKAYIALFICLVTKAIHLELV